MNDQTKIPASAPRLTKRLRKVLLSAAFNERWELLRALSTCLKTIDSYGPENKYHRQIETHISKLRRKIDKIEIAMAALEAMP